MNAKPSFLFARSGALAALRMAGALLLWASFGMAWAAGLAITSPTAKQTLHDNSGNVSVSVALEDGAVLPKGYRIRLLLDGQPAAADARATSFDLSGVERGSHRLQALIVDARGRVIARSEPVTFYMRQASRLFPSRSR